MISSKSLAHPPDLQKSSLISSFVSLAILLPHHPFFLPQGTKLLSTSGPLNTLCLQPALLLLLSWLTPHLLGLCLNVKILSDLFSAITQAHNITVPDSMQELASE